MTDAPAAEAPVPGAPARGFTAALDKVLGAALIGLTVLMVVTVTWQVATRFLLNSPSSYTEELATFLLLWISLLGAAYALRQNAHLGIDVVTSRLAPEAQQEARVASFVVVALFAIVALVIGGGLLVSVTLELGQRSAAFQVPMGFVYLVLPLSGLLMAYYCAVGARDTLRGVSPPGAPVTPDAPPEASGAPGPVRLVD